MAGRKKKEEEKAVEVVDNTIKYRCDFKSFTDYNNYKGKKG